MTMTTAKIANREPYLNALAHARLVCSGSKPAALVLITRCSRLSGTYRALSVCRRDRLKREKKKKKSWTKLGMVDH